MACVALLGCGREIESDTYRFGGHVTYEGKPVPYGTVLLSPDGSQGNSGPGAAAGIVNGAFTTAPGKGHVGGAYRLQVTGYDGVPVEGGEGINTAGTALFPPYEVQIELPKADAEHNIDVPAGASGLTFTHGSPSPIE